MNRSEHDPDDRGEHAFAYARGYSESSQRPSSRRPLILILVGFGVLLLIVLSRFGGTTATISAKGIGPLELGHSSRREMQRWAMGEVSFWQVNKGNPPVSFRGELWKYDCISARTILGRPCRTLFGLRGGHLATVTTTNPLFFTAAGTHIGTPLEKSLQKEHARWSGWNVKCPHIVLPAPKGVTFLATVARSSATPGGFVSGFYLSEAPASFVFCD